MPKPDTRIPARSSSGAADDAATPRASSAKARTPREAPRGGTPTGAERERIRTLERLEEVEKQLAALEKERRELIPKTAAMAPPTAPIGEFQNRKGFNYNTWFKAIGSMESLAELKGGDSPTIVNEFSEFDDFDVPSAFFSHTYLGKVKWRGIKDREEIISELNFKAPWSGNDFRDIYPKWEYVYRIVESVGDVVVNIFEYKAKQPRTQKDRVRGWKND